MLPQSRRFHFPLEHSFFQPGLAHLRCFGVAAGALPETTRLTPRDVLVITCAGCHRKRNELPPSEWFIDYDSLDHGRDAERRARSPSQNSSAPGAVANVGISGSGLRDMMLPAVETRIGGYCTPPLVEILSDNGIPFTLRQVALLILYAVGTSPPPSYRPPAHADRR